MADQMADPKAPTSFLSLPAELRNEIYELSGCLNSVQTQEIHEFVMPNVDPTVVRRDIYEPCYFCYWNGEPPTSAPSLWVNRNSSSATKAGKTNQRIRHGQTIHGKPFSGVTASRHGAHIKTGVKQPALSKASKQVRFETLSIFYGQHSFLFTLFDRGIDSRSIFKYIRTIGKDSVGMLRDVKIVVRSKADQKYVENELIEMLKKLGLSTDNGTIVGVVKLPYPFCYCENCIRRAIGESVDCRNWD